MALKTKLGSVALPMIRVLSESQDAPVLLSKQFQILYYERNLFSCSLKLNMTDFQKNDKLNVQSWGEFEMECINLKLPGSTLSYLTAQLRHQNLVTDNRIQRVWEGAQRSENMRNSLNMTLQSPRCIKLLFRFCRMRLRKTSQTPVSNGFSTFMERLVDMSWTQWGIEPF